MPASVSAQSPTPFTPSTALPLPGLVDVAVIGGGIGGLTAAAVLARRGYHVAVLEEQPRVGGCAAAFRRDGYSFEVGLHYISQCGPGDVVPRILAAAGADELPVRPLDPDGFDTLCFPDFTFRVPSNLELYRERLVALFPAEARGIDRFLQAMREALALTELRGGPARIARGLRRSRHVLPHAYATLGSFLDRCTRDPRLRAVLAAEGATYGAPPSRASLAEHLLMLATYIMRGAYYPAGGGEALVERLASAIRQRRSAILTDARVTRVLVERGRACGVAYEVDGEAHEMRASYVISDADIKHTMLGLVGPAHLRRRTAERTARYEMSHALATVYLGVRRDLRAAGVPATNYWVHPTYDLERIYAEARAGRFDPEPCCFISLATLKDPGNERLAPRGVANVELVTVVPSSPEAWGVTPVQRTGEHPWSADYASEREALVERLVRVAERALPGLGGDVVYREVSTPLTHARYTGATDGTPYGIAHVPSQMLLRRPGARTEVPGLLLCGASTRFGGGIIPVMWSWVAASGVPSRSRHPAFTVIPDGCAR